MWIPQSVDELEEVVEAQTLEETATLEAKREVPDSKKLAKEVASLANDGGVLLIGVEEDDNGRLSKLYPFELSGQSERVDQIIQTCMAEPPQVEIRELWKTGEEERATGYMVVVVPASPRAPHMVIKGGDNRYYGRGAKGVRRLSEGEVARLYQRREKWEIDREGWLKELAESVDLELRDGYGFLHVAVRPATAHDGFFRQAAKVENEDQVSSLLSGLIREMLLEAHGRSEYYPSLQLGLWYRRPGGWWLYSGDNPRRKERDSYETILDLAVLDDGAVHLFAPNVATENSDGFYFQDRMPPDLSLRVFMFAGKLYKLFGYFGSVDVAIRLENVLGASLFSRKPRTHARVKPEHLERNTYTMSDRVLSSKLLSDPKVIAENLLWNLYRGLSNGAQGPFPDG